MTRNSGTPDKNNNAVLSHTNGRTLHQDRDYGFHFLHSVSSGIKADARFSLLTHLGSACWANLVCFSASVALTMLFNSVSSGNGLLNLLISLAIDWLIAVFIGILEYGRACLYMNMQYSQPVLMPDLYSGFRENTNQIIQCEAVTAGIRVLMLLPGALAVLFLPEDFSSRMLLIILLYAIGICGVIYTDLIFALRYYLLLDYPGSDALYVLKKSASLMKGNRILLLYIRLTFLPLMALGLLSFGIANLWVSAYRHAADAAFYRGLIASRS